MWMQIKRTLAPPVFEGDEEKTRVAAQLNIILLANLAGAVLFLLARSLLVTGQAERNLLVTAIFPILLGVLVLMHRGQVRFATVGLITHSPYAAS